MQLADHPLVYHPSHPPDCIKRVQCRLIGMDENWLRIRWRIDGSEALVLPPFAGRGRADELWRTTCFELFLKPEGGEAYCEINLSPSERWAAYDFDGYRAGMRDRLFPRDASCTIRPGRGFSIFDAAIPVAGLPQAACTMGMCAVIEEEGGTKSYWAIVHGRDVPDFHDAACFASRLKAPGVL